MRVCVGRNGNFGPNGLVDLTYSPKYKRGLPWQGQGVDSRATCNGRGRPRLMMQDWPAQTCRIPSGAHILPSSDSQL
eukprot:6248004-Amphidinium_carterae.1